MNLAPSWLPLGVVGGDGVDAGGKDENCGAVPAVDGALEAEKEAGDEGSVVAVHDGLLR